MIDGKLNCSPLTQSQLGVYLECANNPDALFYNITFYFKFPNNTDVKRLANAVKTVVLAHPSMMVCVKTVNGVPCLVEADYDFDIPEKYVSSLDVERNEFSHPFDLEKGPLFRFEILHTPDGGITLLMDSSHLIFDGTSVKVFTQQIARAYNTGTCEPEDCSVFDVAKKEKQLLQTDAYQKAKDFFNEKFNGVELDLKPAFDVFDECDDIYKADLLEIEVGDRFTKQQINEFVTKHGFNANALFTGAFAYAIAKYSGLNEAYFCGANHGRSKDFSKIIGMFVKTMPLYFEIDEKEKVADFLKKVYDYYYETKINCILPFGELAAQYGMNTDISFVFQTTFFDSVPFSEGKIDVYNRCYAQSDIDLNVNLLDVGDSYKVLAHFRCAAYTRSFVEHFCDFYLTVVEEMLLRDTLDEMQLVNADAKKELALLNKTEADFESEKTVLDLFREQVKNNPDNICVVYEEKRFTYAQIDKITDILAKHLVRQGVGAEKVVGILIPRNEFMVIASLGVLKAGGAYLPLDPTYPAERLNLMVKDSAAMLLIYDEKYGDVINDEFKGKRIQTKEIYEYEDIDAELPHVKPNDLFVMLYTSGSTGLPKGVMFEHSNALVTTVWVKKYFEIDEASRSTAYASYGFDAHAFDIYPAITAGAQLHIISDEIRLDFSALREYFNTNRITHTVMTMQVGRQFALMGGFETLKHLSVAGEKLTPLEAPDSFKFYNLYGPTEGSIITSAFYMDKKYKDVPIGFAVDNLKTYVVDKNGKLLPVGSVGELWISGPHVTRGYLNRPEKQKEAYGENTFEKTSGYERVYRTGDIVRLCADGNLQYVGRRDAQVKVRGFRVELTEVEEVIRRFDGVKDATVAAFDSPSGGKFLAAYIVSDGEIDSEKLGEFIKSEKPAYMVPAVTVKIDEIPLNQNGKVNKKALPLPEFKAKDITLPENQMQKQIFDVASEIIGHTDFGVDTDLFEAGLTSIGTIKLNVALGETFSISTKIKDINNNPTVRKLEAFLSAGQNQVEYDILPDYPLTQTQQGILTECLANEKTVAYNIPLLLKISKNIDTERLLSAVEKAIDAHAYLKSTLFADKNGNIRVKRNDDAPVTVKLIKGEPECEKLVQPYNIMGDSLYRVEIYAGEKNNYLFIDCHHILSDGTSENILLSDIERAYNGEEIEKETYSGFELGLDEERIRKTEAYDNAKAFYDSFLSGCDGECLPSKSPEKGKTGAGHIAKVCNADFAKVKKFCEDNKFTLNAFFNTVFGFVLSRFGYKEDVVYTTVYNGRNDSRLANSTAMLVKTLPVTLNTDGAVSVKGAVSTLGKQLLGSMSNDIYSFAEISHNYSLNADIIFVYQGDEFSFDTLCGQKAEYIPIPVENAKAPISLCVYVKNGVITVDVEYEQSMYSEKFISSFTDAFFVAIEEFTVKNTFGEISLMSKSAEAQYDLLNDSHVEVRDVPCFVLTDEFAVKNPDKLAVIAKGESLTYGELYNLTNRIANALVAEGLRKNTIVGMILERSKEVYMCELGIMKAGGAFLPMLPSYPDDRVDFCLKNADSPIVITTEKILKEKGSLFTSDKPYRAITVESLLKNTDASLPKVSLSGDDLAYCIYTSGSTGTPKGVMIKHYNLTNCVQTHFYKIKYLNSPLTNGSMLSLSSISFDMSLYEIMLPICNGKTASMATEDEIHNPAALVKLFESANVELLIATPTFLTNMIDIPEFAKCLSQFVTILAGAESFPSKLYAALRENAPNAQILNGYGPTECAICCAVKELNDGERITIGRPTGNFKFYVTDKFGNVLPPFAAGELIICGAGVGGGYVKLPEKNAACFFNFNSLPAYHSGDLVRVDENSEIAFAGRIDNQIKLRGFRVEPDEIENVTCDFPGIKQCKVLVRNNGSEDFLVEFFTAEREIDIEQLTEYLKSRLTYYMIPAVLAQLDKMPLTANGKIDKKGFPEVQKSVSKRKHKVPKKSLEEHICEIFGSVLNTEEVYADDNFFEIGGTSISASKVTMMLMSENIEIQYGDIFDNPTPEELAAFIEKSRKPAESDEKVSLSINGQNTRKALEYNVVKYAAEVERKPLGDVLLTGAVGFLGIHILKELLDNEEGHIYCLIRKGSYKSSEIRLKTMLIYYFSSDFEEQVKNRISIIDADITDSNLENSFADISFDTVINCSACVKHFADDDILERINVHGVENLIKVCQNRNAKLIQISTVSVPGVHTAESYEKQIRMHENELFVIDDMANKYCISKYNAELKMFDAIENGLRGKVIRVGNLMGRHSDGEFQVNLETNMFMSGIRGFSVMGKYPISHMTDPMSFSPVDCTAKAVVLLSGVNDKFTAFNCNNRYGFDEMKIIDSCNRNGITILPEKDEIYYEEFRQMLGNDSKNAKLNGLAAYDIKDAHAVETDNLFTTNILYRIGFSWPLVDDSYLDRSIFSIMTLDYFDVDSERE